MSERHDPQVHPVSDQPDNPAVDRNARPAGQDQADSQTSGGQTPPSRDRIVVVTQDGMGVASTGPADQQEDGERNPSELIEQPAKVMRIGSMIKQLLDEVRSSPLDEAGRARLAEIHERSIHELEQGLAPELVEELHRITLPFTDGETPSDAELRIVQAQLVGWLEGLFHGIQTALMAQQMAARAQLEQMRHALPPGQGGQMRHPMPGMPGQPGHPGGAESPEEPTEGTGQYL